ANFAMQVRTMLNDVHLGICEACSSDLVVGLDKLGEAYLQAVNVLEYQKGLSSDEFMFYQDVVEMSGQVHFSYTTEQELMLSQAIQSGNVGEAESIIDRTLQQNRSLGVSPQRLRYLLFSIASTVIRTANRLDERYKGVIPSISLPPILQADDFQRSRRELGDIILNLCDAVLKADHQYENSTAETYGIYRKALSYINTNYAEPMLNVSQIADHLGVSVVYLSRSFKKYHQGTNISDYICQLRIISAKKLLSEGALVADVVTLCGFGSLRTFMRVFKKEEQVTPGQYRAMHI
ncbi:MAG: helix-turn-helix transcriptional regulator, partial [Sphaerochaeta sp.]